MIKNIVDYLDKTENLYGEKTAYVDENNSITFSELKHDSLIIASGLIDEVEKGSPVIIFMSKCVDVIEAFLSVAYIGAFYVPIDISMPVERVRLIVHTLGAVNIISRRADTIPEEIKSISRVFYIEELKETEDLRTNDIQRRQREVIDMDPAYAIFTSGSTGIPKGVLVSHRSVINFTEWWCDTFDLTENEIFANQTPFYFDASVKDIFATLRCGATMYIVPRRLFSLPKQLVHFLNEKSITCIDWVPSALCMIVNFRALEKEKPVTLRKVMFLGEVMPTKQFNMWRKALPDVEYANLYGPTEATGDCTYYKVNREFEDSETIPIGNACENTEVFLLDGDELVNDKDHPGEICVRGCSLALAYYNDPEKTDQVFVRNPMQGNYYERIYRTGDIGKYNSYGEIEFISRKDSQIKHMGHRIELREIETAIGALEGIRRACCLYDTKKQRIAAFYEGEIAKGDLINGIRDLLPSYMLPNVYERLEKMPLNKNGKIDRVFLESQYLRG